MDPFPFKIGGSDLTLFGVVLASIASIAINAAIWFLFAVVLAAGAAVGWGLAS